MVGLIIKQRDENDQDFGCIQLRLELDRAHPGPSFG